MCSLARTERYHKYTSVFFSQDRRGIINVPECSLASAERYHKCTSVLFSQDRRGIINVPVCYLARTERYHKCTRVFFSQDRRGIINVPVCSLARTERYKYTSVLSEVQGAVSWMYLSVTQRPWNSVVVGIYLCVKQSEGSSIVKLHECSFMFRQQYCEWTWVLLYVQTAVLWMYMSAPLWPGNSIVNVLCVPWRPEKSIVNVLCIPWRPEKSIVKVQAPEFSFMPRVQCHECTCVFVAPHDQYYKYTSVRLTSRQQLFECSWQGAVRYM